MGELLEQAVVPSGATILSLAGSGLATSVMWIWEPSRDPRDQATVVPSGEMATPPGALPTPPRWAVAERERRTSKAAGTAKVRANRSEIVMRKSVSPEDGTSQHPGKHRRERGRSTSMVDWNLFAKLQMGSDAVLVDAADIVSVAGMVEEMDVVNLRPPGKLRRQQVLVEMDFDVIVRGVELFVGQQFAIEWPVHFLIAADDVVEVHEQARQEICIASVENAEHVAGRREVVEIVEDRGQRGTGGLREKAGDSVPHVADDQFRGGELALQALDVHGVLSRLEPIGEIGDAFDRRQAATGIEAIELDAYAKLFGDGCGVTFQDQEGDSTGDAELRNRNLAIAEFAGEPGRMPHAIGVGRPLQTAGLDQETEGDWNNAGSPPQEASSDQGEQRSGGQRLGGFWERVLHSTDSWMVKRQPTQAFALPPSLEPPLCGSDYHLPPRLIFLVMDATGARRDVGSDLRGWPCRGRSPY